MFAAIVVAVSAVSFVLGILFHKQVVTESAHIKAHVTAEFYNLKLSVERESSKLRDELKQAIERVGQKV